MFLSLLQIQYPLIYRFSWLRMQVIMLRVYRQYRGLRKRTNMLQPVDFVTPRKRPATTRGKCSSK